VQLLYGVDHVKNLWDGDVRFAGSSDARARSRGSASSRRSTAPRRHRDALNQLGLEVEGIDEPGRDINGVVVARISTSFRIPMPIASASPTSISATASCASCAARRTSNRAWSCRSRRSARCSRRLQDRTPQDPRCRLGRDVVLGARARARRRPRRHHPLPADAPLGADVREVLGLDDVVFDLASHPIVPMRWGSAGSPASSRHTSACRSVSTSVSRDPR
jgi:hypothetical protein